ASPLTAVRLVGPFFEVGGAGAARLTAEPFSTLYRVADFALLLIPLCLGYAILTRRAYDINVVVRRGLQYLLARNALRALLALPTAGLAATIYINRDRTLADLILRNSVWFYGLLLAAIGFSLAYRRTLRDWLDRRFFREAYRQDQI